MYKIIRNYFPNSKSEWLKYTLTSLPVIFAAMILSINSFIDNFMATSIQGGNQALSYANQWTNYLNGIFASTTLVGSALLGQYLGYGNRTKIREVVNVRVLIALIIAIAFIVPALVAPESMIHVSSGFDNKLDSDVINTAVIYMRVITISWILQALFYTSSMIIREAGHGKASLWASIISLTINILFNSIFTYVLELGILGLAIATIMSQSISLTLIVIYLLVNDRILLVNFFKIFKISHIIWKQIWKRLPTFFMATIGSVCVSTRFIFWNIGYETGSIGDNKLYYLSAANILGISMMFFNIFWTTFESMNANITIFVSRELGHNNIGKAKANAKKLQGFHLTFAVVMGIIFFALSFAIEKMTFLTEGYTQQLEQTLIKEFGQEQGVIKFKEIKESAILEYMKNLKWTLWPLSWYMPIWIWYLTKSRIISGGGKTNITSLCDTVNGFIQIGWIALINFVIVPNTGIEFAWAYALFFVSDVLKVPLFEILYYKVDWAKNITLEEKNRAN